MKKNGGRKSCDRAPLRYKNIEKHGSQSKFLKMKKAEFQNPQTKAPPQL
jgi:hypothetical protein